jgi:antitoxin component of MazEF toxin-antitoxin module
MERRTVKIKQIGNSKGIIIPAKFLRSLVDNNPTSVELIVGKNTLTFVFPQPKSLEELVEEKKERNKKRRPEMIKSLEGTVIDPEDYIL